MQTEQEIQRKYEELINTLESVENPLAFIYVMAQMRTLKWVLETNE